ncbi:aspartate ammonia-lyase [Bacillus sp. T3]|uniref:aspartate ammonia-lyase n=1 Tax=Bacillus sp. T3 TaxID=467262 RepID=UPI002980C1FC|nr:aspartate ammonia-lyase [Bacillus sp. T3]
MRKEKDSLGELLIEDEKYYGIQTERACANFPVSRIYVGLYPKIIKAVALLKKAAAMANSKIGMLDPKISKVICLAADEIVDGKMSDQFPLDIYHGGGGTSLNMNVNEVIANRANELLTGKKGYEKVHPNTHVNMAQSTNDVIPSAIHIACYSYIEELIPVLEQLEKELENKMIEFENIVKIGRTCLQDAVPLTLGQQFSGYKYFISRNIAEVKEVQKQCLPLPLGATAVGTGLGAYPGYLENVYEILPTVLAVPFYKSENFFDSLQNGDFYLKVSSVLRGLATGLSKMASDFRLLSSGPRAGLSEITLPSVQPGSSIMPGKVNPVIPEMVMQVCFQVYGNDTAIMMAADRGELDLNVWEPLIIQNLFNSFELLNNCITLFIDKCIIGIGANIEICENNAHSSLALSTVIAALFGYEEASKVAKEAHLKNCTIKEIVIEKGILSEGEADLLLNPLQLSNPEKSGEIFASFKNMHGHDK